jgi:hypothetical protein
VARKIIILEQVGEPADYRIAFWLDVPAARVAFYVNAGATSAVIGATAQEIAAIQAGQVVEVVKPFPRDFGVTQAQLRAALVTEHARLQTLLTDTTKWARYGSYWDGANWIAGPGT